LLSEGGKDRRVGGTNSIKAWAKRSRRYALIASLSERVRAASIAYTSRLCNRRVLPLTTPPPRAGGGDDSDDSDADPPPTFIVNNGWEGPPASDDDDEYTQRLQAIGEENDDAEERDYEVRLRQREREPGGLTHVLDSAMVGRPSCVMRSRGQGGSVGR
jgi:hypothetical protein